jgi:UDP-N-acetylglucosamine:LPS N-acetylglucosamine transferase
MTAPEVRAEIVRRVEAFSLETNRSPGAVWTWLYGKFAYDTNVSFERIQAREELPKIIDAIEHEGYLYEFADYAMKKLPVGNPALPVEIKKAPVQGSLLEGEQ